MARCLNLTKTGEYAIAALSRLAIVAEAGGPRAVAVARLAREQKIPHSFLSKILAQCVKAGIVSSRKGPEGGVALSQPADQITLLSIIEACEGSYLRGDCVFYPERRCEGPKCEVYCPLRESEESVREGLAGVTLADMAQSLRRHPLEAERKKGGR